MLFMGLNVFKIKCYFRSKFIQETFGVGYKNPHFDEIMQWMNENNYEIINNVWNPQGQPIGEDYIFQLKNM